ncbi:spore coat protein CotF [Evansella vedderi]|uniref:Spore coat protein CotF n=1 Tax=Evansella vedderi TaxID=38282 RepID=A0ABT9ZXC8_9BACI|nr:spore coat protein [Evansella vedderi]MDQ0254785.1 spore coat protein CotF [Evansella vedderi]
MNYAAHELLETQEALRTKAAEIEQHGAFVNQCNDQHLKGILQKHQQLMINAYQQGINLMNGRGAQVTHRAPDFHGQNVSTGMQNQTTMSAPSINTQTLSDQTIATLALNTHKSGSVMGMQWANECVDPQIRMYHVNGANLCQEMAYEVWSWMNQNGYYQPTTFSSQQVTQMTGMFQPLTTQQTQMSTTMNTGQMQ